MATGELRTKSAVRVPAGPEIAAVQVIGQEALAELDVPVAQVELEALAGREDQVVPVVRAALVVPEDPAVPVARAALVVPENQVARVGLAVPAAPAELVAQVALAELALVQVEGDLELVQVEVVPELVRLVVPLRIKSAIAARPRGLAQVPRGADLAVVVVEIMHEPAATEVAIAWAAAG
jgi:hypothetical protein